MSADPSSSSTLPTAREAISGRSPNYVLVVEDDPDLAEVVLLTLESEGYETKRARNGQEALDIVAQAMPALILLDMHMPRMDGWEFARRLRETYAIRPPIVVTTAAESAVARAATIGADDALSKPFQLETLLATVARFVR